MEKLKIDAKVVACTTYKNIGVVTTLEVTMPKFLQAEVNTHRILAKSAMSSRAVPIERVLEQIENDPFIPRRFGVNKPGMQPAQVLEGEEHDAAVMSWRASSQTAAGNARFLAGHGVHKEHVNRIVEPYMWTRCVITGTSWSNFIALRTSPKPGDDPALAGAMYDMQDVADAVETALRSAVPAECAYHLPYVNEALSSDFIGDAMRVSAARCARVSFRPYDGTTGFTTDRALGMKLSAQGHWGPFDHPGKFLPPLVRDMEKIPGEFVRARNYIGSMVDFSDLRAIEYSPVIFGDEPARR